MASNFFLVNSVPEESLAKTLVKAMADKRWFASRIPDIGTRLGWLLGESDAQSRTCPEFTSMFTITWISSTLHIQILFEVNACYLNISYLKYASKTGLFYLVKKKTYS